MKSLFLTSLLLVCVYILNAQVTGTGTANTIPLFTGTSSIGNSNIFQSSSNIGIGTTPSNTLDVLTGTTTGFGSYALFRTSGGAPYQGGILVSNNATTAAGATSLKITSSYNGTLTANTTAKIGFVSNGSAEIFLNNGPAIQLSALNGNITLAQSSGFVAIGGGATPACKLDLLSGDAHIASGNSLWVGGITDAGGNRLRLVTNGTDAFIDYATNLHIRTNGTTYMNEIMYISSTGKVGIGTIDTRGYQLAVVGSTGIIAEQVTVLLKANWPDFVFEKEHKLMPLSKVELYIKENKHLPDVPSATEVEKDGVNLGKMDAALLQKIEELTLYSIEQNKKIEELTKKVEKLVQSK